MKLRYLAIFSVFVSALFFAGCGGSSSTGGGGAVYRTVSVTASPSTSDLDADVATWTDVDGDGQVCGSSDTYTIDASSVDVTVTSTSLPDLPSNATASQVEITKVTIKYTPADNTSPAISDQYEALSVYVSAGGSATIPVRVGSQELKGGTILSPLVCSGQIYKYYVTLKFEGVEVDSDTDASFEATLNVRFADFVN